MTVNAATRLIDRYAAGGALLSHATSELTPAQAVARPGPGAWSIVELAVHLLDADLVIAERMKRVLAENDPVLLAFDEDAWIARLHPEAQPLDETVRLFATHREWMSRILRACSDADFARAGRHSEAGRKTLAELLATAVGHLDHHLRFLYGKRANLGVALPPHYSAE